MALWSCGIHNVIEGLYIGDIDCARDKTELQNAGITHILCAAADEEEYFPGEYKYLTVKLQDNPRQDILQHFNTTNEFIETAIAGQGKVLVHCRCAMSRSATVVIAYLMSSQRMKFMDAWEFLKTKHDIAHPNSGFREQLERYEYYIGTYQLVMMFQK